MNLGITQLQDWISIMNNFPIPEQKSIRISQCTLIDNDKLIITKDVFSSKPYTHHIHDSNKLTTKFGIAGITILQTIKDKFKDYIFQEYENGDIEMDYHIILAWKELEESKKNSCLHFQKLV